MLFPVATSNIQHNFIANKTFEQITGKVTLPTKVMSSTEH